MVKDYVASCATCAHAKSPRHKPYGKLKQLLIPSRLWSSISMDFIKQLPNSEGFSAILVIINHLTKQVIFIPSHNTVDAPQVVQLFLIHVFSKHRVPVHVVDGEKLRAVLLINPTKSTLLLILNRGEVGPKTQGRPPA